MIPRTLGFLFASVPLILLGCSKDSSKADHTGSATAALPAKQRGSQLPQIPLPPPTLPDDPKRAEKVELGHHLFFDKRLSGHGDLSCYSCHQNEDGNGGHDPVAIGSGGKKLSRHAPVIWNVAYAKTALYWDGRAKSLEDNAKGAWSGPNMDAGKDNIDKLAGELAARAEYKKLFEAAYPGVAIKAEQVQNALAEYERTLICKDTAYDKFANGDKAALSEQQQNGLDVFLGKGLCTVCHTPPYFSQAMANDSPLFFDTGIGTDGPADAVDVGRMKVTNQPTDWAAFKPPSLRNVARSAPYFHDGSVAKLADAVKFMASGGNPNRNKTPLLEDRKLTQAELDDLVAFLGALDCPGKLEPPADMASFTDGDAPGKDAPAKDAPAKAMPKTNGK